MSRYHRLPIAQKRAENIARVRELAVTCPGGCGTQVMRVDLLAHLRQRCPGQLEPGPSSKWVSFREARELVPKRTLARWVKDGHVRIKGGRGDQLYLHGDLVDRLAARHLNRRR